jgi:hypothetical protein
VAVTFTVSVPAMTPTSDDVYIAGDFQGWDPGATPMTRIDATLRALLRAAVFELTQRKDVPFKVIIREYVDVALAFYDDEVPGMVNGVLDAEARKYSEGYEGPAKA